MHLEPTPAFWLAEYLLNSLRYLLMAGSAWLALYVLWRRRWAHRRIQQAWPAFRQIRREVLYSLSTFAVFSTVGLGVVWLTREGHTRLYFDIAAYGWGWLLLSTVLLIVLHDTYFYWTHRAMHHPLIFRHVHLVHHQSTNPTPWAAFSFHPLEAVVEAGIVPLAVLVMPLHPIAIGLFFLYMTALNVIGHLGYELFPSGFTRHWLLGWSNTSTHHNQHHKLFRCNYGLYFNWWGQWMGTNHERYHEAFEATAGRSGLPLNVPTDNVRAERT